MVRKAKTCWGCKSLAERPFHWEFYCGLFYPVKMVESDPVPQEPCPKPRTWAEWNIAKEKEPNENRI